VTETPQLDAPLTVGAQREVRATHPDIADRTILKQHDRSWSYRQYRDESVRTAHFLLERLGKLDDKRPGHVAMLLENHLELLSLYAGCA
jgi:acyl-CoA synthetase (AMP-forming)/AMP-acid ligase II